MPQIPASTPARPYEVPCGAGGSLVTNVSPVGVFVSYRDDPAENAPVDGTLAPGESVTLAGLQYMWASGGLATVNVVAVAVSAGSGSSAPVASIFKGAVPIATRHGFADSFSESNGTDMGGTYRRAHKTVAAATALRLAYTNKTPASGASNAITVKASIERFLQPIPVTFNGQQSIVIPPGVTVVSDPVAIFEPLKAGEAFFTRTTVSVTTSGHRWPLNQGATSLPGEGNNRGTSPADLTYTGNVPEVAEASFGPTVVLGSAVNPARRLSPIIGLVGDSKVRTGYVDRALHSHLSSLLPPLAASVMLATSGETTSQWFSTSDYSRFVLVDDFTHVYVDFGTNDINSGDSAATVKSSFLRLWTGFADRGAKVIAATVMPNDTFNSAKDTVRVAVNTWLRAGAPIDPTTKAAVAVGTNGALLAGSAGHPLTDYIDVADTIETSRDSNDAKAGYLSDDIHPSPLGQFELARPLNFPVAKLGVTLPTAPAFNPAAASGLIALIDPDAIPGNDGDAIGTVTGPAGGMDATQATTAARPILKRNVALANGHSVLRFDGSNDYLDLPSFAALTEGTIMIAYRAAAHQPPDGQRGLWQFQPAGKDPAYYLVSGLLYDQAGRTNDQPGSNAVPAGQLATWNIITITSKPNEWRLSLNGGTLIERTVENNLSNGYALNVVGFATTPKVGANGSGEFLNGDVGLFAAWNRALTRDELLAQWRSIGARLNIDVA